MYEPDREVIYKRTLRTSLVISHKEHTCDYCHHPIPAGDEHEVEVVAVHVRFLDDRRIQKMISTWRRHADGCEPDDEEDEDEEADADEESGALPLAA